MKTPDILIPALMQYQHNDCSGLLMGFDYEETIKAFKSLPILPDSDIKYSQKDIDVLLKEQREACAHNVNATGRFGSIVGRRAAVYACLNAT